MGGMTAPVTSDQRPLRADAERNRRRLLAAAGELFAEKGLGVGLDEIARHAGVGVGTAYRRFRDKDALIEALFEDRIACVQALAEAALAEPDPWTGLVRFMEGSVRLHSADRGLKQALFGSGRGLACLEEGRTRIAPLVEGIVERARESGDLRPDIEITDIPILQFTLSGVADLDLPGAPELGLRYLTIVLDGLRTREPSPFPVHAPTIEEFHVAVGGSR
jgi:AcrR family transcriptional regulator